MTIRHALSADGLAILSLTARSLGSRPGGPSADEPKPLGPREWARVGRALAAVDASPADLLGREATDLATLLGGATGAAERIGKLAARATTLSLEVERLASRGIWLISAADSEYPSRLRGRLGESAPPILYGAGAIELLDAGGVAIVGARDANEVALAYARGAAAAVARSGRSVVSGGARGIDAAAMTGAAEAGGTVVGALADSLERQVRATDVRALIADERLALVSPYGPDIPFSVGNAMGRNRLIYCLADEALVVSTSEGEGGTWAGATEALGAGWVPVYVRTDAGAPPGNSGLVTRGAVAIDGGPERAAALPLPVIASAKAAQEAGEGSEEAKQQTLFGNGLERVSPPKAKRTKKRTVSRSP